MESVIRLARYYNGPLQKHKHYHDCHQIIFVKKGELEVTVNSKTKIAHTGDVIFISRYENHSIKVISKEYERFVLEINAKAAGSNKAYAIFINRTSQNKNIASTGAQAEQFCKLFLQITEESVLQDKFSNQMQEMLVNQLLINIYRLEPMRTISFEDEYFDIVYDLQNKFENSFYEQYSLKALAESYHISVSTLCHRFKKITGVSVLEYLYSCRIASAKNYLAETNFSIGEIVEKCGFTDNSNFSRTFKEKTGLTPTQFRNKYKKPR